MVGALVLMSCSEDSGCTGDGNCKAEFDAQGYFVGSSYNYCGSGGCSVYDGAYIRHETTYCDC